MSAPINVGDFVRVRVSSAQYANGTVAAIHGKRLEADTNVGTVEARVRDVQFVARGKVAK